MVLNPEQPRELRKPPEMLSVEKPAETPKTLDEIRSEMGNITIERRDLRKQVTEAERVQENEIREQLGSYIKELDANVVDLGMDSNSLLASLETLSLSAQMVHEARMAGLFELYELAEFDDRLLGIYDKVKPAAGANEHGKNFETLMSKELMLRELEKLYNDTTQQIGKLYEDINAMGAQAPEKISKCGEGLCQCADDLFNFEVGGVLRVDEFLGYVEVLRENHAKLLKLSLAKGAEMPPEFQELLKKASDMLDKHEANLEDVKKLMAGQDNIMSFERYNELAMELAASYKYYIEWQKKMVKESHAESVSALDAGKINPDEVNWDGFGTTIGGKRFQIGLRGKKGCEYGRCANCCLFHGSADGNITAQNITTQFDGSMEKNGLQTEVVDGQLRWVGEGKDDLYRIDFNGSGSFLNDKEMPREARLAIFDKLAKLPFKNILIESRIEYINEEAIKELKSRLRPDQKMELAIGLESANNLIRELSVAKGYSLPEFEKSVEVLAKNSVDVFVYSIVKPALISEKEALEDAANTGRYLADLIDRTRLATGQADFKMTMKLEQAFIQKGGYLDYLHNTKKQKDGQETTAGMYETPWAFTIAEIVQKLADEGVADRVNLQIGRSDDYPPPTDITRNRDVEGEAGREEGGSTIRVDRLLQQYNIDHDVEKFSAGVQQVIADYPETFEIWKNKLG
jgi:radical SAM enzyme (TIGR01210 family)